MIATQVLSEGIEQLKANGAAPESIEALQQLLDQLVQDSKTKALDVFLTEGRVKWQHQ